MNGEPPLVWLRSSLRSRRTHKRSHGDLVLPGDFRGPGFLGINSKRTHRDSRLNGSVKSGYLIDANGWV